MSGSSSYSAEAGTGMKECDVVMKGGVTSGVVYPGAICEIARNYRIRGVGGASAGARWELTPALDGPVSSSTNAREARVRPQGRAT
jgi:hypothetical protein